MAAAFFGGRRFFGWSQHFFGRHPGGTIQLAEADLTAGIQNQFYFKIHTVNFLGGERRNLANEI
jgi:hypothetical protein